MENERPVTRWRRDKGEIVHSRDRSHVERPKSRRGASFQEEIEKSWMRPPTSVPKTYNTYIGTGTAIFQPDQIPMGLQPQIRHVAPARLSTGRIVRTQPERMVRDKKYYEGLLRVKMNQLNNELRNMRGEMDRAAKELSSYYYLKSMVKELASKLTESQARLADHNLALQKINIGSDPAKTMSEARELLSLNNAEESALEILFTDRIRRQEASQELQNELNREMFKTDQMIASFDQNTKELYNDLVKQNSATLKNTEDLKREIDSIGKLLSLLGDQVCVSPLKLELYEGEIKLWDLLSKKEALKMENQGFSKPEEEYQMLLNKIRQDNLQMATMEKTIAEIMEKIKEAERMLNQLEDKKESEGKNIRQVKYIELRKKELAIDDFLYSVESHREGELSKLRALDAQILPLLKLLSTNLAAVPTPADYKSISLSQSHVVKSDLLNTVKSVGTELKNLTLNLKKLGLMDAKVDDDLSRLKKKISVMTNELETFENTNDLETKINIKKKFLTNERERLINDRSSTKELLKSTTAAFNETQKQLSENEKYAQILFMEKKLVSLSYANHAMQEYIQDAATEENIEGCQHKVLNIVKNLNEYFKTSSAA